MRKEWIISLSLTVLGLVLQIGIGPVDWTFFAAPVSYIVLGLLLALIGGMYALKVKMNSFPCLCLATGLTLVMGLTEQVPEGGIPWLSQMVYFWPFVLIWTWFTVLAGLAALDHLLRWQWREIPFILTHLGIFVTLVCATLGSADYQTIQLASPLGGAPMVIVKDPWLPTVYVGIGLMLAGALCQLVRRPLVYWIIGLAAFFGFIAWRFIMPKFPHLQSPWFAPHIMAYMMAYTILAVATVLAIYSLIRRQESAVMDKLVLAGVALLTFGMLLGALWAKEAWGDFWLWDPKETWAAITWLAYLIYVHICKDRPEAWRPAYWLLFFAFLCLQMSWWGINYLPSAQGHSLHLY